jgi:hypothetical protein
MSEDKHYDAGPGHPLSGCGDGATAMSAAQHYLEAERCRARMEFNDAEARVRLESVAMLHYVAAIAASLATFDGMAKS